MAILEADNRIYINRLNVSLSNLRQSALRRARRVVIAKMSPEVRFKRRLKYTVSFFAMLIIIITLLISSLLYLEIIRPIVFSVRIANYQIYIESHGDPKIRFLNWLELDVASKSRKIVRKPYHIRTRASGLQGDQQPKKEKILPAGPGGDTSLKNDKISIYDYWYFLLRKELF